MLKITRKGNSAGARNRVARFPGGGHHLFMQRLFSIFPTGQPGAALLLMRFALAVMLLDGLAVRSIDFGSPWYLVAPATVALALCLGFLTPVAAALVIALEVVVGIAGRGAIEAIHVCAVLDAIALAMLGPGAYSLDGRLFGRRRVIVRGRGDGDEP